MADLDTDHQNTLNNIRQSHRYFDHNYKRFNWFTKFVFETTLSSADRASLSARGMPQLEFNILEAPVSKLRGEFARQEPSLSVHILENADKFDINQLKTIEGYIRAIMADSNADNLEYDIFTDQLVGGFSVMKVYTDYANNNSFDQNILVKRAFDPTLCVFDQKARLSHKGDGDFCCELYPYTREEFESKFGKKYTKNIRFIPYLEGFNWNYKGDNSQEYILVGDYYSKKIKKKKIVQLITGEVIDKKIYNKFVDAWNMHSILQAPAIVAEREAEVITICRHIITQDNVIEYQETDYQYFPLIFVDGNSVNIRSNNCDSYQLTRPYVYNAVGIQKLKNLAGNTVGNELENMIQHKLMACAEGIPEEYKDAYIDFQKASVLIYNAYKDNNPDVQLPQPQTVPRVGMPPEVAGTFTVSDEMTRAILGNYDASLSNPGNNLSGEAIAQSAMQSNYSSAPYHVNYIKAMNRLGQILLDLIPKYITTPRSIPIKGVNSKRMYQMVNADGHPSLDYDPNSLQIRIEAGVNFEIQRARSFEMLNRLMQTMPLINEYISTNPDGIEMLLDNIDIRGIDALKEGVEKFAQEKKKMMQQQQQQQQQMAQMQMQMAQANSPAAIKNSELQQKGEQMALEYQIKQREVEIKQQLADADTMKVESDVVLEDAKLRVAEKRVDAQNLRSAVDMEVSIKDKQHSHALDLLKHDHMRGKANKSVKNEADEENNEGEEKHEEKEK